jgi:glycosyltransferase involved in cell wall biosynthesis
MVTRLLWVLQQPTPYNVYLLNQIEGRLGVPSEAVYRWSGLASHPWSDLPPRHFSWRVVAQPGARDRDLERRCGSDEDTFVVFAGWRDGTIRPALLARARARLPFAFWTDTPKTTGALPRWALDRVFVWFARRAITTLATGAPAIERYLRMGVPSDRLENFPFVVDPRHFGSAVARRSVRPDDGTVRFVLPARLIDRLKGQSVAFEALQRASSQVSDRRLELIVAGIGPDDSFLRDLAQRLGIARAVRFAGWVEYAEMPALLASGDALVLPSHWDPFPVAVIEAMAAGMPVLGSDACGSVRERVVNGDNGFIHRAGDTGTFAEHMRRVATDPALCVRLGHNALSTSRAWGIGHSTTILRDVLTRVASSTSGLAETCDPCVP